MPEASDPCVLCSGGRKMDDPFVKKWYLYIMREETAPDFL